MLNFDNARSILELYSEIGINETVSNISGLVNSVTPSALLDSNSSVFTDCTSAKELESNPNETMNESNNVFPDLLSNIDTIEELYNVVDRLCECKIRTGISRMVFADGNPKAQIMLIGEAPGEEEDKQGIPFCGKSGKLLDKMLATIGLERSTNLYITNTVFWRPPGNRKPEDDEIFACRPFVTKHIAIIRPKLIILCGSTAMFALFKTHSPITKLSGSILYYECEYSGEKIKTIPIFHPSYLLRNPIAKKQMWFDLLKIQHQVLKI